MHINIQNFLSVETDIYICEKKYILKIRFLRCRPVILVSVHLHIILFGDFEIKAKGNTE